MGSLAHAILSEAAVAKTFCEGFIGTSTSVTAHLTNVEVSPSDASDSEAELSFAIKIRLTALRNESDCGCWFMPHLDQNFKRNVHNAS